MSIIELALKKFHESGRIEEGPRVEPKVGVIRQAGAPVEGPVDGVAAALPRRVVHLDRAALISAGFLPPDHKQRQVGDQFRHVKRPLLAAALGRGVEPLPNGRMIMITSSLPGEGKTFVSINLVLSIALERDISVVLVDADVAKQHVSSLFGVDAEPGLLEAVKDENLDVESLILPTDVPNLSVLSAGQPSNTATELLASLRMESVIWRLGGLLDRKRVVIFDSPPVLLTSESRVLAQHMGQIVLAVRAGNTPQHAVLDAIDCLGESKNVVLLLNQSESISEAGYYYRDRAYGDYARDVKREPEENAPSPKR